MGIHAEMRRLEAWLESWPSGFLSVWLLIVAAFLVYVALRGNGIEKAAVAAWVTFP